MPVWGEIKCHKQLRAYDTVCPSGTIRHNHSIFFGCYKSHLFMYDKLNWCKTFKGEFNLLNPPGSVSVYGLHTEKHAHCFVMRKIMIRNPATKECTHVLRWVHALPLHRVYVTCASCFITLHYVTKHTRQTHRQTGKTLTLSS